MVITPITFFIVCPLVFLAGLVDAIGGGGGLISLPAYMIAGLPAHMAIATNKLSSCCGTALAAGRFMKRGLIDLRLGIPAAAAAFLGACAGAKLSLFLDEKLISNILMAVLVICALLVFNKKLFRDYPDTRIMICGRTLLIGISAAFIIGIYDGLYGPGTGTFLLICLNLSLKISIPRANGLVKLINLTSNVTALVIFLMNGQVLLPLGAAAALCNMAGGYLGAGMVMKGGAGIVKPVIILVLILLALKLTGIFG